MKFQSFLNLALGAAVSSPAGVFGLTAGDADLMWNAYNNVFLNQNGSDVYYQKNITFNIPDTGYTDSFDIFVAQDVYLRTGNATVKTLVNSLCNSFLTHNPPGSGDPWHTDGYNDDIGWFTLGLIRGYQITGNSNFLSLAMSGFDYAFNRGWNTTYNDGGIWEQNPEYIKDGSAPNKQPLSNDSLGKVACMIYQSTHNATYLSKCTQIYGWVRTHLFNTTNGWVYNDLSTNGTLNTMAQEAYNQGTFADFANLLYEITGNQTYYNDAKLAVDFGKNNCTVNGIFSNTADYLSSWADEYARGAGNFIRDNKLWGTYYPFFLANANGIMQNRRTDLNITWNGWNQLTPKTNQKTNHFVSAVAWLQYTPPTQPTGNVEGIRVISNNKTGLAVDSTGAWGNGKPVVQNAKTSGQSQRWQLTQNSIDQTWNIINLSTWQALQSQNGSTSSNATVIQWQPNRNASQRWNIVGQSDGTFRIWNVDNGLSLDGGSLTANGSPLSLSNWTGSTQQRWNLQ